WRRGEPLAGEVPEVDPHATRRTGQPLADPAATRRTERPAGSPGEPTRRTGTDATTPAVPSRWRRFGVRDVVIGLSLIALSSQAWVRGEARQIQRDLAVTANPDLDAEWTRFQRADRISLPLLGGLGGVRDELKESLATAADRVVQSYHGDDASTAEGQWQRAQRYLQAAVQLDYGDKKNRAKMVYCEGQIDRIESERLRRQGARDEAQKRLGAAVEAFDRAARWDSSWPDPYLGLARIYAYDQFDLDKLQAATDELSRRGYPRGRRETAMLADGHRRRGIDLQAQANGMPPERAADVLANARYHLQRAVDLYDQIPGYGSVQKNRDDAQSRLEAVEERWSAIERSS
ncbi:MAG TPA: hypothetical protein VOA87_17900, partial [Thermoanaerobaculia bacterium]|nr:hypothetical protein [Thermoanaerobaculia bacterium]